MYLDEDSEDFFILLLDSLDFFEADFEEEEEESTLFESDFSEEHDSEDSQLVDDLLPDSRYKPHICRDKFVKHEWTKKGAILELPNAMQKAENMLKCTKTYRLNFRTLKICEEAHDRNEWEE